MMRPDDQAVASDARFLRALTISDWWKDMGDRVRVCSVAFFVFEADIREPGQTSCYTDTTAGRAAFGRRFPDKHAARFIATQARNSGFNITRDPDGDPDNSPEHFVLTYNRGVLRGPYQKDCKELALASTFTRQEILAGERRADQIEVEEGLTELGE